MNKKYLLSSDNGYHWNTSIMFDSIENAVVYHVNEQIDEYLYDWKKAAIKKINRPLKSVQSYIEVILSITDSDGDKSKHTVYISELSEVKPENKYNVTSL